MNKSNNELSNRKWRKTWLRFYLNEEDLVSRDKRKNFTNHRDDPEGFKKVPADDYYQVNELLSLRREGPRTYIEVNGMKFIQCVRLLLSVPTNTLHLFNDINSIDDFIQVKRKHASEVQLQEAGDFVISPEEEFVGHCSNVQAWAEHDYDTRILHSNLAFPLLKKLALEGDEKAKSALKDEIVKRYKEGNETVRRYLKKQGFLDFLTEEERLLGLKIIRNIPRVPAPIRFFKGEGFVLANPGGVVGNLVEKHLGILKKAGDAGSWELVNRCKNELISLYERACESWTSQKEQQISKAEKIRKLRLRIDLSSILLIGERVREIKELLYLVQRVLSVLTTSQVIRCLEASLS